MISFCRKILALDKRIIYVIMFISMALPMFMTFGLPIRIGASTQAAYDIVDALPANSIVFLGAECGASQQAEMQPMINSLVRHVLQKDLRLVVWSNNSQGATLAEQWSKDVLEEFNVEIGVNFVNIGYRTGFNATLDKARTDFVEAMSDVDINNNRLSEMPLFADLKKASDIDLVIALDVGSPGTDDYIASWQATGDVMNMIGGVAAVEVPNNMVKYSAGLLKGLVGGMSGAAQYEKLVGNPSSATSGMDSQGLAHLTIVIFIAFGNIAYVLLKRAGEKV